jgi:hypothetical protein
MAKVLIKSLKEVMPESKIIVCLIEKEIPQIILQEDINIDEIVLAKDLGFVNFNKMIFKYNQYEAACACKGILLKYVYDNYSEEIIVYLDSDIQVLSRFNEIPKVLESYSIVLTPHHVRPANNSETLEEELVRLKDGVFNGGFIAIKRSKEAENFLNWWIERLERYAYVDRSKGLFTDQKWLNLVPVFFEKTYIFKHEGYNVACWNIYERNITENENGYLSNEEPLRFFHFSHIPWLEYCINKLFPLKNSPVFVLITQYQNMLNENHIHNYSNLKWTYNYFNNGKKIKSSSREIYRNNIDIEQQFINPFEESNKHIRKGKKKKRNID